MSDLENDVVNEVEVKEKPKHGKVSSIIGYLSFVGFMILILVLMYEANILSNLDHFYNIFLLLFLYLLLGWIYILRLFLSSKLLIYAVAILIIILYIITFTVGLKGLKKNKQLGHKNKFISTGVFLNLILIIFMVLSFFVTIVQPERHESHGFDKPVIYLYPQTIQDTTVQLFYNGELKSTYPSYDYSINGWRVTAYPDGKIIDDRKEYSYLFWDGISKSASYDLAKGFVVRGEDTEEFLQEALSKMGLMPKEYNEFIVYWLPKMEFNKYNLIHFADKEYTDIAKLKVTPQPDSLLRVFMVFKPLKKEINVMPQELKPFRRNGFAVVEWGGTEIK